jgi:DNA-binding NarL/FixJ family response regulator
MRILLVDDGQGYARDMAKWLQHDHKHDVVFAAAPEQAGRLLDETVDVAMVDVLYEPLLRRLRWDHVSGSTSAGPFLDSGLAVLQRIRERGLKIPVVIWSDGADNRILHMRFAYDEYGVRVFQLKDSGDVSALHRAALAAAAGQTQIDPKLEAAGLPVARSHAARTVRATIFHRPIWVHVWRALARGATRHEEIQSALGAVPGYDRRVVQEMAQEAANFTELNLTSRAHLAFCIRYARDHREFFVDSTVRRLIG